MQDPIVRATDRSTTGWPTPAANPVLIVDDDPACLHLSAALLRILGYPADTAANGREALEVFDPARHLVVVTDNEMHPIKGTELALLIKERCPATRIIMCSGRPPLHPQGVDGVITKPLDLEKLRNALDPSANSAEPALAKMPGFGSAAVAPNPWIQEATISPAA